MKSVKLALLAALFVVGVSSSSAMALVPDSNDSFDQSQGGAIVYTLTSPTFAGFDPIAAIGGANGGGEDGADTIFSDTNNGTGLNVLTFTRTDSSAIRGVNLFVRSDPAQPVPSGDRSTGTFTLESGTIAGGVFTSSAVLVNGGVPDNSGAGTQFTFAATTATAFRATFTTGEPNTTKLGERIIEIDAVAAPEPASIGLLALGGIGLLARRRRT